MKQLLRYFILILIVSTCGQRDVLIDKRWILIGGTLQGNRIDFVNKDRLVLTDSDGEIIQSLVFLKYGDAILPGVNSGSISARWKAAGNKINLSIEPMQPAFQGPEIYQSGDSIETAERLKKFDHAMHIYGQEFEYSISLDTLRLFSKDVKLWAVRDNSLGDLTKHFKPKPPRRWF